jgi:hypothetical protein
MTQMMKQRKAENKEFFSTYKTRTEIEGLYDSMKNGPDEDCTYIQNEQTFQGWMFINHFAPILSSDSVKR